jgi:Cu+-exporting ATPase
MLTGESLPVDKAEGDQLIGATINTTGTVLMRTTAPQPERGDAGPPG